MFAKVFAFALAAWVVCAPAMAQVATGVPLVVGSTSPFSIDTYGTGTPNAVTAYKMVHTDNSALTSTERETLWLADESAGTGDGTGIGATYPLVVSALKTGWNTGSAIAGQVGDVVFIQKCGYAGTFNNPAYGYGDCSAIQANSVQTSQHSIVETLEAVSTYSSTNGADPSHTSGDVSVRIYAGSIRKDQNSGVDTGQGYYALAAAGNLESGLLIADTNAIIQPAITNPGTWAYAIRVAHDDGTNAVYNSFVVTSTGAVTIAGPGGVSGTTPNAKTIRVGGSVTNNLEFLNAAKTAVIMSLAENGTLTLPLMGAGTPVGSVCIDTSGNLIKKTTTGSCV